MKAARLLIFLFCLPVLAFSQTTAQTEALTTLTKKFIALYNTGDTGQYRAFTYSIDTAAEHTRQSMEQFTNEQNFVGRVDVKNIRVVSPTETQTLVQTPHFETWWQVIVITDSLQRFKEHHMRLLRVTDDVLGSHVYTKGELAVAIDSFVKRQSVYEPFNGNVLIQKAGTTVYARSFGSGTNGKPHTMQDAFELASVGKMFTAVS